MSTHNLRHHLSVWLPVLLWMGGIFVFSAQSSLPGLPDDVADILLKKSGHAAEYAVLAILAVRAFRAGRPLARGDLWRALLLAALYAATDEFHQGFVPGRNARLFDWSVDVLGASLGLLAIAWRQQVKNAKAGCR